MTLLTHLLAAGCYALASLFGFRALRRGQQDSRVGRLLFAGVIVHAAGLAVLHLEQPPVPLESFAASLSLIGWSSSGP